MSDSDIRAHRTASATVTLLKSDRTPLANQQVVGEQKNHKFLFGCTGFEEIPLINNELKGEKLQKAQRHAEHLVKLFNFMTLPFYWGRFEPTRGKPDTKRVLNAAKWFVEKGLLV